MNRKFHIRLCLSILCMLSIPVCLKAQMEKVALAYDQVKRNSLDSAKQNIDASLTEAETAANPQAWMVKGLIYKELYKSTENTNPLSTHRETSRESFLKAMELDKSNAYAASIKPQLKYLATRYFNDIKLILNPEQYQVAINYFNLYVSLIQKAEPGLDIKGKTIDFYLALGSMFNEHYQLKQDLKFNDLAKSCFITVLEEDSNQVTALKNIGVNYYNQGVDVIMKLSPDDDITSIEDAQDKAVGYGRKALPYLQKAYQLSPKDPTILEGLMGIYYLLNETEKYEEFKKIKESLDR